jgi:hypothetical protein
LCFVSLSVRSATVCAFPWWLCMGEDQTTSITLLNWNSHIQNGRLLITCIHPRRWLYLIFLFPTGWKFARLSDEYPVSGAPSEKEHRVASILIQHNIQRLPNNTVGRLLASKRVVVLLLKRETQTAL